MSRTGAKKRNKSKAKKRGAAAAAAAAAMTAFTLTHNAAPLREEFLTQLREDILARYLYEPTLTALSPGAAAALQHWRRRGRRGALLRQRAASRPRRGGGQRPLVRGSALHRAPGLRGPHLAHRGQPRQPPRSALFALAAARTRGHGRRGLCVRARRRWRRRGGGDGGVAVVMLARRRSSSMCYTHRQDSDGRLPALPFGPALTRARSAPPTRSQTQGRAC